MKRCFKPILLLAAAAALAGCWGTVTCPELKESVVESVLVWTPYEKNDTVLFTSKAVDYLQDYSIMLIITNVEAQHITQYSAGSKCGGCRDEIRVTGTISGTGFEILTDFDRNNKISYQHLWFTDSYFLSYSTHSTYAVEDVEYKNVRVYNSYNSDNTDKGYKTLIIAKDVGIVGLVDFNDSVWYIKKNDGAKNVNAAETDSTTAFKAKNITITNKEGC